MNLSRLLRIFALILLAGLVVACGVTQPPATPTAEPTQAPTSVPTNTPAPIETAAPTPTLLPATYKALPAAECQAIQAKASAALKVPFSINEAPFVAPNRENGTGCILEAKGTGVQFKNLGEVSAALQGAFFDWTVDPAQDADGPTGWVQGLRQGNTLLLMSASWQPSAAASCPADRPIQECGLPPEQMDYTITLTAAVPISAPAAQAAPATTAPTVTATVPPLPTSFVVDQVLGTSGAAMNQVVTGSVNSGAYDRYRITLAAGQNLDIELSSPQQTAGFVLLDSAAQPLPGTEHQRALWFSSRMTVPGDYAIIVGAISGRADYTLIVKTSTGTASSYVPLPAAECQQLGSQAQGALGVAFIAGQVDFTPPGSVPGKACNLTAFGNGNNFTSVSAVVNALLGAFGDWSVDNSLAADGATGSLVGLRRGGDLMTINVSWQPSPDANCPSGQPISSCELTPEQRLYTITIQAVRR